MTTEKEKMCKFYRYLVNIRINPTRNCKQENNKNNPSYRFREPGNTKRLKVYF